MPYGVPNEGESPPSFPIGIDMPGWKPNPHARAPDKFGVLWANCRHAQLQRDRRKSDEFEHTPCFATVIDEVAWTALKSLKLTGRLPRPVSPAGDQPETGP